MKAVLIQKDPYESIANTLEKIKKAIWNDMKIAGANLAPNSWKTFLY